MEMVRRNAAPSVKGKPMKKKILALAGILIALLMVLSATVIGAPEQVDSLIDKEIRYMDGQGEDKTVQLPDGAGLLEHRSIEISEEEVSSLDNVLPKPPGPSYYQQAVLNSDWGYGDMALRSNGSGRQAVYRLIDQSAASFHTSGADAQPYYDYGSLVTSVNFAQYGLSQEEAVQSYYTYRNDHPLYYWLSNMIVYSRESLYVLSYDEYARGSDRNHYSARVNAGLDRYRELTRDKKTNFDIALAVHDQLILEIDYAYKTSGAAEDAPWAHNVIGVFDRQSAVCEGYAMAYQLVLNALEVPNIYVTGMAGGPHAWNMAQMDDGAYYWIDTTFDDQPHMGNGVIYSYFNTPESEFTKNHTCDTPEGAGYYFLYGLPQASDSNAFTYETRRKKVTGVGLNRGLLTLKENETFTLKPFVEPEDASNQRVFWGFTDKTIVEVDYQGNITAKAPGTAYIAVQTEDGGFEAYCEITVVAADSPQEPSEFEIILNKEDGIVRGIPEKIKCETIIQSLRSQFPESSTGIRILTAEGLYAENQDLAATGMWVVIENDEGFVVYGLVITGELTGDGVINILDMLALQDDILGKEKLRENYAQAADVTSDGVINIMDMLALQDHILGKEK